MSDIWTGKDFYGDPICAARSDKGSVILTECGELDEPRTFSLDAQSAMLFGDWLCNKPNGESTTEQEARA